MNSEKMSTNGLLSAAASVYALIMSYTETPAEQMALIQIVIHLLGVKAAQDQDENE